MVWWFILTYLLSCSIDIRWVKKGVKKEDYGKIFYHSDGTRLYPKSAVTGSLSEDDRRNIENSYGKKKGKIPPFSQGIDNKISSSPPPLTHTPVYTPYILII